ncbi:MAG TPA: hypothetical protein VM942_00025 [Acidimicrobiales bacterium]|nr:hypothetical protein [Acidimicrobiales bacterium]
MSSIWTPSGERPVGRPEPEAAPPPPPHGSSRARGRVSPVDPDELTDEEMAEQMMAMQEQVLATPAVVVVANHCMALFELAALYLSPEPPRLADAQAAIDAMAAVIEAVGPRFGPNEKPLREALAQLRMAFVEAKSHTTQSEAP